MCLKIPVYRIEDSLILFQNHDDHDIKQEKLCVKWVVCKIYIIHMHFKPSEFEKIHLFEAIKWTSIFW